MSNISAFATLDEKQIEKMIDSMTYAFVAKGTTICVQGELAEKFYVVMSGLLGAYVKLSEFLGEQRVGDIPQYTYFGENALLGLDAKRNATVRVESDGVSLMVLEKVQFYQLVEDGEVDGQVLTKMWNEKRVREESNQHQQLLMKQLVEGRKQKREEELLVVKVDVKEEKEIEEVEEVVSTGVSETATDFSFA